MIADHDNSGCTKYEDLNLQDIFPTIPKCREILTRHVGCHFDLIQFF